MPGRRSPPPVQRGEREVGATWTEHGGECNDLVDQVEKKEVVLLIGLQHSGLCLSVAITATASRGGMAEDAKMPKRLQMHATSTFVAPQRDQLHAQLQQAPTTQPWGLRPIIQRHVASESRLTHDQAKLGLHGRRGDQRRGAARGRTITNASFQAGCPITWPRTPPDGRQRRACHPRFVVVSCLVRCGRTGHRHSSRSCPAARNQRSFPMRYG